MVNSGDQGSGMAGETGAGVQGGAGDRPAATLGDLKAPLVAAVGAANLALEQVNDVVAALRARAGGARTDARSRVEETRDELSKLMEDMAKRGEGLWGRLYGDRLRRIAGSYREQAAELYQSLIERGEAAVERLATKSDLEGSGSRTEPVVPNHGEVAAPDDNSGQTSKVSVADADRLGVELPTEDTTAPVKKAPAKKAAAKKVAKKALATKAAAKKVAEDVTP